MSYLLTMKLILAQLVVYGPQFESVNGNRWRRASQVNAKQFVNNAYYQIFDWNFCCFIFWLVLVVALSEDWFAKTTTRTTSAITTRISTTRERTVCDECWNTVCSWRWKWLICHNASGKGKCRERETNKAREWEKEGENSLRVSICVSANSCFKVEQKWSQANHQSIIYCPAIAVPCIKQKANA